MVSTIFGFTFWRFLVFYGVALYAVTPSAQTVGAFFRGEDNSGRHASQRALTASIFISCLVFSFVGIEARLTGLEVGENAPAAVAQALGIGALFVMTVLMISAAGSTLDSTFASLSKIVAQELPAVAGHQPPAAALRYGTVAMIIIAVLGNLPMIAGAEILAATTVSGTMVMGLAPIFLLQHWTGYSPWSFHLSFWPGLLLGILLAVGWIPAAWAIGEGKYALLLGTNLYGLLIKLCRSILIKSVMDLKKLAPEAL